MSNYNNRINNYVDLLVIETISGRTDLSKVAQDAASSGMMSGIADKIKGYVSNNVDPNDKAGSLLNMIAPGIISTTFSLLGLGKIGFVLGLLARMFHFDLAGIFRSIYDGLKEELSGGKPTTSENVHNIVQNAVQANTSSAAAPPSPETHTVAHRLRRSQIFKLALESQKRTTILALGAAPSASMLSQILSFLFRVIVSSAGLMVAGDTMNHFLGRPNAIDNPIRGGQPVENGPPTPVATRQTRFPLNPSYQDSAKNSGNTNWVENVSNNPGGIGQMLLGFAKDVYSGLDGQEGAIQSDPYFQNLVETISWYNHESSGGPIVFIPHIFTSKKQLVDQFINDVAEKLPAAPQTGDMKTYKL